MIQYLRIKVNKDGKDSIIPIYPRLNEDLDETIKYFMGCMGGYRNKESYEFISATITIT